MSNTEKKPMHSRLATFISILNITYPCHVHKYLQHSLWQKGYFFFLFGIVARYLDSPWLPSRFYVVTTAIAPWPTHGSCTILTKHIQRYIERIPTIWNTMCFELQPQFQFEMCSQQKRRYSLERFYIKFYVKCSDIYVCKSDIVPYGLEIEPVK